jgi:hypothetical protein
VFDFGRGEVRSFLVSSALFWLSEYHFDGLRVDAVASMLYRDYSRRAGEWLPNREGGRENLEAIAFVRELNRAVRDALPGCITIAEESTTWPGVTRSVDEGGLGFTFKWNLGWMHDTLAYFARDPLHRKHHQDQLTFAMIYEHSERFVMPLSHDEVVHGKRSLLSRMPGDEWQRFANLRCSPISTRVPGRSCCSWVPSSLRIPSGMPAASWTCASRGIRCARDSGTFSPGSVSSIAVVRVCGTATCRRKGSRGSTAPTAISRCSRTCGASTPTRSQRC